MYETPASISRSLDRLLAMERELRHLEGFDGWVIGSCSFTVSTAVASSMVPETETQLSLLRKSENRTLIHIQTRDVSSNKQIREASTNDQTREALADVPSADTADQMRVLLLRPTAPIPAKANTESDHAISNGFSSVEMPPRCASAAGRAGHSENASRWSGSVEMPPRCGEAGTPLCFPTEEIARYLDLVSDYNSIHRGSDAIVPGFLMVNRLLEIFLEVETPGRIHANVKFPAPLKAGEPVFLFRKPVCMEKTCFLLLDRAGQIILNMEFF